MTRHAPHPAPDTGAAATQAPKRLPTPAAPALVNPRASSGRHAHHCEGIAPMRDFPASRGMPVAKASTPVQRLAQGLPGTPSSDSYDCPVSPPPVIRMGRREAAFFMVLAGAMLALFSPWPLDWLLP